MPADDRPFDKWLISLYVALKPDEIDLHQLAPPGQLGEFAGPPSVNIGALTNQVDLAKREERYAANLAYTLGIRVRAQDDTVEDQLATLGATILQRLPGVDDPEGGEKALRNALRRLMAQPKLTADVVGALGDAFKGAFDASPGPIADTWSFTGPAAETATMLTELASMNFDCESHAGHVRVDHQSIPVTVIEYEICTQSPFERTAPGVDPRNWTTYNPSFFDSVELLTAAPTSTDWNGVIQEKVGANISGSSTTTNLAVSYVKQDGLAAVTYDLAPKSTALKDDDNSVTVDYGLFAVMDEGMHRRVRMLKVVHVDGVDLPPEWMCPLWAHQLAMIGWWF